MLLVLLTKGVSADQNNFGSSDRNELKASDMQVFGTEHLIMVWAYIFFCL